MSMLLQLHIIKMKETELCSREAKKIQFTCLVIINKKPLQLCCKGFFLVVPLVCVGPGSHVGLQIFLGMKNLIGRRFANRVNDKKLTLPHKSLSIIFRNAQILLSAREPASLVSRSRNELETSLRPQSVEKSLRREAFFLTL